MGYWLRQDSLARYAAWRWKMQRLTITVPEAARILGVSRMTAYTAVREGAIPSLRIGRRVLIPRIALDRLLAQAGGASLETNLSEKP
jgi:excisionase family DNA binding protein